MTGSSRHDLCSACLARIPERLVLLGLRGWMAGYETGDIACWEAVWNDHARTLGPQTAKPLVTELSCMVRLLRRGTCPLARFYPPPCRFLCRDECLALGLIAGCQAEAWAAADSAARKLAGANSAESLLTSGRLYAAALSQANLRLHVLGPAMLSAIDEGAAGRLN
jgi:hypothetical protein